MLPPDNRVVLLDQLRPSVGYSLDAAVATTFTLDLTTALVAPLAFASFEMRGSPDPLAALESVRSCAERVDIFCQAGSIYVPSQVSDLMAFLEPMVHEVRRPRPGRLFHPKIWFLRYSAPDLPPEYRLLCSTRNLTSDQSWDALVRLDGGPARRLQPANQPLARFIDSLADRAVTALPFHRIERLRALSEDARRVEWALPEHVHDIQLHALGLEGRNALPNFDGYRHLVVAPFCNDEGLAIVAPARGSVTLVSRVEELDQLSLQTVSELTCMTLNPLAGLGDPDHEDRFKGYLGSLGLHAKIVIAERNRLAHVFIGSANATAAAFKGNVEFVIELIGGTAKLGVEAYLGDDAAFRDLLESYEPTGGASKDLLAEEDRLAENLLRDIACQPFTLAVGGVPPTHELLLMSDQVLDFPAAFSLSVELLTCPGAATALQTGESVAVSFTGIQLADITPFVVVRVSSSTGFARGTVVRARLINDPADRLDAVLARQVDSPEKFLRFLGLLLGLTDPAALFGVSSPTDSGQVPRKSNPVGVLELILRALADRPEALLDLDRLVSRLRMTDAGLGVLPEGFDALWQQVMETVASLEVASQ